ncbi:MAG: hypothetical protein ACERKN_10855 [Velocimicrobium sp.]
MEVSGEFTVKDNYQIIGYAYLGYNMKLIYTGAGEPVVRYEHSQDEVGQKFIASEDKKHARLRLKKIGIAR